MQIREIYSETMDNFSQDMISMEKAIEILSVEIVPRKLVEEVLESLEDDIQSFYNDEDVVLTDFDEGYLSALKDYKIYIRTLLSELEED